MPRLTNQEQQEVIRFIKAGKPLPDKYRFLLFEDRREVELAWNGRTNDICNSSSQHQLTVNKKRSCNFNLNEFRNPQTCMAPANHGAYLSKINDLQIVFLFFL